MGTLFRASILGAIAGIVAFIGVFVANAVLGAYDFAFLRNGGGGFNLLWLGALPCLVAAVVAAAISRTGLAPMLGATIFGAAGGTLSAWAAFNLLAGMQGLNPLIFSGPFCAAIIAAGVCMRSGKRFADRLY